MKRFLLPLLSVLGALLAGGLALADPPAPAPAVQAAPAVGLSSTGKVTTKASEMDCSKLQEKTLGDLTRLRTEPEKITSEKCKLNATARANDDETASVGEEKVKGACQATYNTINHYAEVAQKKLDEVCEIVTSAHELRENCETGQKACVSGLATKDRAAASKLKELTTILKQAQKDLSARRKTLKAVADKYKDAFAKIDEAIQKAGPNGNLQSALSGVPNDVFSPDASNGWTALSSNGFDGTKFSQDYNHYRADVDPAFDPDANSVPVGLGHYTNELVNANGAATEAIKTVDTAVPRVNSAADRFDQRADNLTGTSNRLSSIELGNAASSLSSLSSGARNTGNALANMTGASRMIPVAAGQNASAGHTGGAASLPPSAPGGTRAASSAIPGDPIVSALPGAGASPAASSAAQADPKPGDAAKPVAAPPAELLSAFTSLGPITGGDEYDSRVAEARGQKGATYVSRSRDRSGSSELSGSPESPAARGTSAVPQARAASGTATKPSSATDVNALRDALRRRLAERTQGGGDADASAAVDEILYALPDRSPASGEADHGQIESEQAGPQARDSEPLFQRVHHAHRRFQQRIPARTVNL